MVNIRAVDWVVLKELALILESLPDAHVVVYLLLRAALNSVVA